MNKKQVIISHSGKQHSYFVADALRQLGYLKSFYTSSYVSNITVQKLINKVGLTFLQRRYLDGLGYPFVKADWLYEIRELVYRRIYGNNTKVNNLVLERDEKFDLDLSKKIRRQNFDVFWGFQGSCLNSIKTANSMQKLTVCEMTIAHLPFAKKILTEEANEHPEWADSIDFSIFPARYEKRLIEEPHLANHVIAISDFLKFTLLEDGIPDSNISVIPLGFNVDAVAYNEKPAKISDRPLKLLYVGKITQRKGIKYLLDAMSAFSRSEVELHIIGNIFGSGDVFKSYSDRYIFKTGISQMQLFSEYCNYDALVFPSLMEGFGLVTVEAMGAGLPVISTPHTNAQELIQDGINGYKIPIRDTEAIIAAIGKLRSMSDDEFQVMRQNARKTALDYTWSAYVQKLSIFLTQNID